ncbi:TMhelix containing protein [Vibrio phage 1.022.O._10N.286.45.A10]|nr:TMhelix containing protein [Vibrio phage 1.022.O._10N.286.45.A10]
MSILVLLLTYLNVLIRYALRFGLIFLTAWITTCTWDTTLSMTMESQLNGLSARLDESLLYVDNYMATCPEFHQTSKSDNLCKPFN